MHASWSDGIVLRANETLVIRGPKARTSAENVKSPHSALTPEARPRLYPVEKGHVTFQRRRVSPGRAFIAERDFCYERDQQNVRLERECRVRPFQRAADGDALTRGRTRNRIGGLSFP